MKTETEQEAERKEPNEPQGKGGEIITITNLRKAFSGHKVLQGLDIKLMKGENLVVLGKSGTGKSVLIKCIAGLIEPDDGTIMVLDKNVTELEQNELDELRKDIGFLFQSAALYDSMTVRENLEFPLRRASGKKKDSYNELVEEALKNVGLADAADKMPSDLSGGMRKRIGLARSLILKPQIMLYDEPTTGLDPVTSREISELILEVQKKYETSSVIITHDMPCAHITANRIVVLRDGVCTAEGTWDELHESQDPFVRSFFE